MAALVLGEEVGGKPDHRKVYYGASARRSGEINLQG